MRALGVLLLAGCSAALSAREGARECNTASDCFEGEECVEGVCSLPGDQMSTLFAEVAPPEGPSRWLEAGPLSEAHALPPTDGESALRLDPLLHVEAVVRAEGGVDPIPAVVAFSQPSLIGRAPTVFTSVDGEGTDLPAGCYAIQVFPTSSDVPPFYADGPEPCKDEYGLRIGTSLQSDGSIAIVAPPTGRIRGRLAWADGTGIDGVEVQAFAASREASAPVQTTRCEGGEESGCFELVIARSESSIVLRVSGARDVKASAVPTVTIEQSLAPFDDPPVQDLGDLRLGAYGPPIRFAGIVEGSLPDVDGSFRVPGARILLRSTSLGGDPESPIAGTLQREVSTGLDGSFEIQLLAGTYDVRVIPPGEGDAGRLGVLAAEQFVNDPDGDLFQGGQVFSLEKRVPFAGTVFTSGLDDVEADGIAIDALGGPQLFSAPGAYPDESAHRSWFAASEGAGAFTLDVDPGHYDLYFRPPLGVAAAWTIEPDVDLLSPVSDRTVVITSGSVFLGHISQPTGAGYAGVTIRLYTDVGDGFMQIGEAVTDANGDYLTFLPIAL